MSAKPHFGTILPPGTELTLAESKGFTSGYTPSLLVSFYFQPKEAPANTLDSNTPNTNSPTIMVLQAEIVPVLPRGSAYTNSATSAAKEYLTLINDKSSIALARLSHEFFGGSPKTSWRQPTMYQGGEMLRAFAYILRTEAQAAKLKTSIILVPPKKWDDMTAHWVNHLDNITQGRKLSKSRLQPAQVTELALTVAGERMRTGPRDVGVYWMQADGESIVRISAECKGGDGKTEYAEPPSEAQDRDTSYKLKRSDGYVGGSEMGIREGGSEMGTREGFSHDNNQAMNSAKLPQMLEEDGLVYVLDPRNGSDSAQLDDNSIFELISEYLSSKS